MTTRILILGGSWQQIGLVRAAKKRDFEVCVWDQDAAAVASVEADLFQLIDIADVDACLQGAKQLRPDAVVTTGTDLAVMSSSSIAAQLGLPGVIPPIARRLTDKEQIHRLAEHLGIDTPNYGCANTVEAAVRAASELRPPWVFKPVDSGGSRGVSIARVKADASAAALHAFRHSRRGRVCVEEWLDGPELGCQAYVPAPRQLAAAWTHSDQMNAGEVPGPIGHALPCDPASGATATEIAVARLVDGLEGFSGFLNFDFIRCDGRPVLLEVGARFGGGSLPKLVLHHTGVSVYDLMLDLALGHVGPLELGRPRPVAALHIPAPTAGVLQDLHFPQDCHNRFSLIERDDHKRIGDEVRPYLNASDALATVYCGGSTVAEAIDNAKRCVDFVEVRILRKEGVQDGYSRGLRRA